MPYSSWNALPIAAVEEIYPAHEDAHRMSEQPQHVVHSVVGLALADGGPSRSIPAMADAQARAGARVQVIDTMYQADVPNGIPRIALFHGVERAKKLGALLNSPSVYPKLRQLASEQPATILHDHGLWLPPNRAVAQVSREFKLRLIVSPRGMLSAWSLSRKRFVKKILWQIWQLRALQSASGFHATSPEEANDIRKAGFTQPIAIIPNSVNIPAKMPQRKSNIDGTKCLLFLSRIHPVKGVKELLHAFKQAELPADWVLSIVGPEDKQYGAEVKKLCGELNLNSRVNFFGSINDTDKWQHYADADVFVLPSFSENFGIVIAEAMAAGLPVITTTGTPWRCLKDEKLGWWIEPTVSQLVTALKQATLLDRVERQVLGQRSSNYIQTQFSIERSAQRLLEFYDSLSS